MIFKRVRAWGRVAEKLNLTLSPEPESRNRLLTGTMEFRV